MNADQPGFMAGVLLGGAGIGAIAGLVPLFLGVTKNKTWLVFTWSQVRLIASERKA